MSQPSADGVLPSPSTSMRQPWGLWYGQLPAGSRDEFPSPCLGCKMIDSPFLKTDI